MSTPQESNHTQQECNPTPQDSNPTPQESTSAPMNLDTNANQSEIQPSTTKTKEVVLKKRKFLSPVWKHFEIVVIGDEEKAVCNYCHTQLLGTSHQGTSHLRKHFDTCPLRQTRDIRQCFLKTEKQGKDKVLVGSYIFNQDVSRMQLAKMIILHEYPLSMVDHYGFKEFCASLQPQFKGVSRNTIKSDIMKIYEIEKENTRKLLSKNSSRIAITTDMWTASHQNRGYMVVTAHYVDDSWVLRSRIVRFIYVPAPHTAKVIGDVLFRCLMDWNLDRKLSTLTVDNCTTNDGVIRFILGKISHKSFILGGQLFHMRCAAHILNLVVKDGLSIISDAIVKVRNSVDFWTTTPKREEKFQETCEQENIPYDNKLDLDCKTRWNSTFFMLSVAIKYKDVFSRLSQREEQYKDCPSESDWVMATEICERLELFYKVTELFSGTNYPTTNVYFPKLCKIKMALIEWVNCPNPIIHEMATAMIEKFDKYWGVVHGVMAVGTILDPRYKMALLTFYFPKFYGAESYFEMEKVKAICQDLVTEYGKNLRDNENNSSSSMSNVNVNSEIDDDADFDKYVIENYNSSNCKSELDRYLEELLLPRKECEFDILNWWKTNGAKYPTLQMIAKDLLAIPISTVASESAFSTSGRFLSPHRSRLRPHTLEALMCLQDWLWTDCKGSSKSKVDLDSITKTILDDIEDDDESIGPSDVDGGILDA